LNPLERERLKKIEDFNISVNGDGPRPMYPPTLADLFAKEEPEYHWIIDGLMERGDRLVLTGREGYGKSTFLRQLGVCSALGIHPTTFAPITRPLTVFLVDLENSERQLRREFVKVMRVCCEEDRANLMARYHYASRIDGLQLDDLSDKMKDRMWLEANLRGCIPDLLIIGPLYKMMLGDPQDEVPSRNLVKFLDQMRERYHCSIAIEAHAPHKEQRVYGWSGWKRWPEFGMHLDEQGVLTRWRGDREERAWPTAMRRGNDQEWLWNPTEAPPADEVVASKPSLKLEKAKGWLIGRLADVIPQDPAVLRVEAHAQGISHTTLVAAAQALGIDTSGGDWNLTESHPKSDDPLGVFGILGDGE
jgi:AAA domain